MLGRDASVHRDVTHNDVPVWLQQGSVIQISVPDVDQKAQASVATCAFARTLKNVLPWDCLRSLAGEHSC